MTEDNALTNVQTTSISNDTKPCKECRAIVNIYFKGQKIKKPDWKCEACPFEK